MTLQQQINSLELELGDAKTEIKFLHGVIKELCRDIVGMEQKAIAYLASLEKGTPQAIIRTKLNQIFN